MTPAQPCYPTASGADFPSEDVSPWSIQEYAASDTQYPGPGPDGDDDS